MKSWKILTQSRFYQDLNERGQSIIEFVLLLSVVTALSYGFVFMMNKNLANFWQYAANLIVDDKPGTKTVKIKN